MNIPLNIILKLIDIANKIYYIPCHAMERNKVNTESQAKAEEKKK